MNLRADIQKDFNRVINKLNPRKETINGSASENEVLRVHYIFSDYFLSENKHLIYGLTPENGIDSNVFFKDVAPLYELIREYEEPLRRLKDE